jgi:hypothetical protein
MTQASARPRIEHVPSLDIIHHTNYVLAVHSGRIAGSQADLIVSDSRVSSHEAVTLWPPPLVAAPDMAGAAASVEPPTRRS